MRLLPARVDACLGDAAAVDRRPKQRGVGVGPIVDDVDAADGVHGHILRPLRLVNGSTLGPLAPVASFSTRLPCESMT